MAIPNELRKTAADTGYAVVGVTDIAVERIRQAQARAAAVRSELEMKKVSDRMQQAPTTAVAKSLEAAGKVEEAYGDLSERGKRLVERIRTQRATQDLLAQGKGAVSRTRAAVTTTRRGVEDTGDAVKATATTARREIPEVAEEVADEVSTTTRARTAGTRTSAKRTTNTAQRRSESTSTAAKGAATSAKKTAEAAAKATESAAEKVGR